MNGGTVSSHSLKTQMVTSYAQSGPGQRSLGKDKPQYCNAYADILQAEIGCPSGCRSFVAEQRENLTFIVMDKSAYCYGQGRRHHGKFDHIL